MKKLSKSKPSLVASVIWIVLSIFFLDVNWGRIHSMHAAGQIVTPWRYVQVVFWVLILLFWSVLAFIAWQRKNVDAE